MKFNHFILFTCTWFFLNPSFAQDSCNIRTIKNADQAIAAQECVKKISSEMKALLGANEQVIKNHLDFIKASIGVANDCLIIEKSFLNKKNGRPYNSSFSEEQLSHCDRVIKEIAVALTNTTGAIDKIKARTKMTEDAIEAFSLKANQLSLLVAQFRIGN